jgi:Tol biopolymer transport system component
MGEVYRATDTRLDRTVAIKVLQGHLTLQPEVRQRFEREARVISSLNHPHICTLYDIGHQDGIDYLVMEYLEGETLADRLTHGSVPLPELLKFGTEIADALDRAHRQGLVHRDLKPGNIMLTSSGAKLLDFGLARVTGLGPAGGDLSSPTMSRPITAEGTIVGTYQYMAPETLEGGEADARSDLFSFGAVLYEMATGRRAFSGRSQASLIASIMREQPRPVAELETSAPPALDRLILRCLEKNPDDRYQTARDVLLELRWVAEAGSRAGVAAPVAARRKARERLAWGLAAVTGVAALTLGAAKVLEPRHKPEPIRFFVSAPPEIVSMGTPKVSPNGRWIAYNALDSTGVARIWVRPMGSLDAQPLPGTEGASRPFWSPDSRLLGFMADNRLKKIAVTGGPAQTICQSDSRGDGSWSTSGLIFFDGGPTDSVRYVNASGGVAAPVTTVDRAHGETGTAWPMVLPDGRHFLYLGLSNRPGEMTLKVGDIKSKKTIVIEKGDFSRIEFVAPGYIFFVRDRALLARPFDTHKLQFTGDPFPVADNVAAGGGVASNADFSASQNGIVVFRGGLGGQSRLVWVDRTGKELSQLGLVGVTSAQTLSPRQNRVAMEVWGQNSDIWIADVTRGVSTRFTFDAGGDWTPVWSPDGSRIAFASDRSTGPGVYLKSASGAVPESLVYRTDQAVISCDWSPDGRDIACMLQRSGSDWDIEMLPTDGRKPFAFVSTPYREGEARFSPDGRWIAYSSNESGTREVYIQAYPASGGKWQVSTHGARDAEWSRDGKVLYFLSPGGSLWAVDVSLGPALEIGSPKLMLTGILIDDNPAGHHYAVSADQQRFLVRKAERAGELPATTVYMNWMAAAER